MRGPALNATHDPGLRSWVADANRDSEFPIQNLPLGIFSPRDSESDLRGGIAIGEHILDLRALHAAEFLSPEAQAACLVAAGPTLNSFLGLGLEPSTALRRAVSRFLCAESSPRPEMLHLASDCTLHAPCTVGDFTDFYAGLHHARSVGELFRPDNPLLPNYKWVPIAYHGRASSVRSNGVDVRRPGGQRKRSGDTVPTFGPTRHLDFELELGIWTGPGNALGQPISIAAAHEHIAGYSLLNDWSARDLQAWEYQPLGPFLAKSFHTTISGWIITPEALAPFRRAQPPRPAGDPLPLPYLLDPIDQAGGALDLELEVLLLTSAMRERSLAPERITRSNAIHLYWTPQQLLTHHASNGCNLVPGDLLGTGTISAPEQGGAGSLLEITRGGQQPLRLASGELRTYLEDGDEVILRATAKRDGFVSIGFGECRATILPTVA
jgi:fumarylacetoacetase